MSPVANVAVRLHRDTTPAAPTSRTAETERTHAAAAPAPRRDTVDHGSTASAVSGRRGSPASGNVVHTLTQRAAFNALAGRGTGAGAAGMPEVKFIYDRQTKQLYFMPKQFQYHYEFASKVLGYAKDVEHFNREAYIDPDRRFVPGTLTAYDHFENGQGRKGVFGMSFWSTDPVRAPLIKEAFTALQGGLPFAKDKLVYHPGGNTQEHLLQKDSSADAKSLKAAGIGVLSNAELASHFSFMALNPGKSFGTLRIMKGTGEGQPPPTHGDICIYEDIPATLPPMAGVITPKPQTYLSHVALKARQDDTPYAYARDILKDPAVKRLAGKVVSLEVTADGYKVKAATAKEAKTYLQSLRPKKAQELKSDLTRKATLSLDKLSHADASAYGSKTVNVAELAKLYKSGALNVNGPGEPEVIAPDGFGLPASMYDAFMKTAKFNATQTFDERLTEMLADPDFKKSPAKREKMLDDFREAIEDAEMPRAVAAQVKELETKWKAKFGNANMRIRSSSDSEDLVGFNGAGLFDSYTFRWEDAQREGRGLDDRIRKVFASVWNARAFSEFDFYRVNPHSVKMAELVVPNTDDEKANGVVRWGGAIPGWDTMSLNAQVGENLVTNPDGGVTPDAVVVGNYGIDTFEPEIQYEANTNQRIPNGRKHVLTDGEIRALFKAMKVIQEHFARLYHREGDPTFNIECEFKITKEGKLLIKQARPWVE
ncbi:MAG: hypothetical protein HY904_17475 [Deltaproteobacteria bacterium]|nr:hypothetical protein [Deltaproteobacteria bacterium]